MIQKNAQNMINRIPANRRKLSAVIFSVFALLAAAMLGYYVYGLGHAVTDDAYVEAHVVPISPKVAGHVIKVVPDDNQEVKTGDLLIEQDPRDYQAKLDMAKADLEAAKAEKSQAAADAESYRQLASHEEISKQQLDRAVLRLQTAAASVSKAEAYLNQCELQLSYTHILSPSDGRVTKKSVEEGAYLQPGQNILAIVTPERWVTANFKETQLTRIRPGQPATIKIDTYPGKLLKGRVDSIQRGTGARFSLLPAENATGNYVKVVQRVPVKILFDEKPDDGRPLLPGLSSVVNVDTSGAK